MMNKVVLVCVLLSALLSVVSAHSWMQCADYVEENGRLWSEAKCRAWPRRYEKAFQYSGYNFGADAGYNHQPEEGKACPSSPAADDYSSKYPAAKYHVGQRICLAWPPKNHVAANCNNKNIGDAGTKIYRSGVNPSSDPSLSGFRQNLVHDFGINTGVNGMGFQNCPNFCADAGAALCTGCFAVPNLAQGKYTFLWEWAFNGPADLYTTCFDIEIVANSGNAITATYTHKTPDDYKALLLAGTPDAPTGGGTITQPTAAPTKSATNAPTVAQPTAAPTNAPPTAAPTVLPTLPGGATLNPTTPPSAAPTQPPTTPPTALPTVVGGGTLPPTFALPSDCLLGAEKCACTKGGACDPGLQCASGICVNLNNLIKDSAATTVTMNVVVLAVFVALMMLL